MVLCGTGVDVYCSVGEWPVNGLTHMPDVLPPVHSTEDWQAAFGFTPVQEERNEVVSIQPDYINAGD